MGEALTELEREFVADVVGLFLVGVYAVQGGRIKERHRFALILRKAVGGAR